MPLDLLKSARFMQSVLARTRGHLLTQYGLETEVTPPVVHADPALTLCGYSAVIGLGGPISIAVIASFDASLVRHILERDLGPGAIAEDELETYLGEAAAETTNVVLGHCTADLAEPGAPVTLSPPLVILDARSFRRPRDAVFLGLSMQTPGGRLALHFVGPAESLTPDLLVKPETENS